MITDYPKFYYEAMNGISHPAGYSNYSRIPVSYADDPDDQGEVYKTDYFKFLNRYRDKLEGKKVLDIGCAKGFFVDDMRGWGVECMGIDGSEYAISQANEYCSRQDLRTYLPTLADNAFDTIVGLRFLPCLTDEEITDLLPHILRVAQNRIFVVDDLDSYQNEGTIELVTMYYNVKTLDEWQTLMTGCAVESIKGWRSQ